jgi:hypothetical protein
VGCSWLQDSRLLNSLKPLETAFLTGLVGAWFCLRAATLVGFTPDYLAGLLVVARFVFLPGLLDAAFAPSGYIQSMGTVL